jgi:two-component system, NtrC family, sensor histidine kinase KinB
MEISTDRKDTRESLELLYHISREIASTLDLSKVLQRVLFLSMRNIGATSGSIIALDDSGNPVASNIIHEQHIIKEPTKQLRITLDKGLAGWVVNHCESVLIPDTSQDERWLHRPDDDENATGAKSAVSVPFLVRDQVTGVITLIHKEPHFFNLDHLALVQAIVDQAGVAVLNARLYAESQHQAQVMTALAKSAAAITASLDREEVLQQILEQSSQALQVEAVSLALIDKDHHELIFEASTSKGAHDVTGLRLALGQGIAGWVAKVGEAMVVPDVHRDTRFYSGFDQNSGFTTSAIACAPVCFSGKVIGVLEAINPLKGSFDPDALMVLTGIGNLAGSAIRHSQHFNDLGTAHQRYRDLFEDNINSMLITDWKGLILEVNLEAVRLSGYDRDTMEHLTIDQLHDLDRGQLGEAFAELSSGETITYESVIHTQSGVEIPIEVRVHATQVEGISCLQWVLRNIQERKELDQLRDDLISSIYHDLRSPLSNVVSSLDVLANMLQLDGNPAILSLFNIAVRSTERIQRLTNSLLDINRLEAGQPIVNRQPVEPKSLVQDALDAVSPIAKNKSQEINTQLADDLSPVTIDGDMIRRVLINLTENAVKFTPPDGNITIGAQSDGEWVRMWVEDSGPGIPDEKKESIFDKFTRLHGKDGPAGFGLGLAYCRLAVEGHNGRIWIEDTPKSGARFVFTLPLGTGE